MDGYIPRLLDGALVERLRWTGAVVIDGPKAVGKTETGKRAAGSQVFLDSDSAGRQLALADPRLVLDGQVPRLLDEWQTVPALWNSVRREVDERQLTGQFILTGSASPADDSTRHTGTGRIARLRMHPLTLFETEHSSGEVSLSAVLDGEGPRSAGTDLLLPDLVERIIVGGWPASQRLPLREAARYARGYLDQIARLDVAGLEGVQHDPTKVAALLRSLARTTASEVSVSTLAADAGGDAGPLHRGTVGRYLQALRRVYVLEEQEAWGLSLRTRTALRESPKRHLTDTSLVTAALRISTPERLLRDPETLGLVFESLVVQQLRAYGDLADSEVKHFRAKDGREVDAIVIRDDGAWIAIEIKLGAGLIDDAAASLKRFAAAVDTARSLPPSFLVVVVPTGPSYVRDDGIAVISLTTLGP